MQTKISKWGNSLAVRIPKASAEEAHLTQNTPVELSVDEGRLVIEAQQRQSPKLDQLLAEITEDNVHAEIDAGGPVGREVW